MNGETIFFFSSKDSEVEVEIVAVLRAAVVFRAEDDAFAGEGTELFSAAGKDSGFDDLDVGIVGVNYINEVVNWSI